MAIWTLHTYRTTSLLPEKRVVWSGLEASWDRSKASWQVNKNLTLQPKSGLLLFSSWQIIYTIIFKLTYYLWLSCRQCARQSQACKFQQGTNEDQITLSHKGERGASLQGPHCWKHIRMRSADHILPLTFTITLYVNENNKAASFSDGKLGAREDTIWEQNPPKLFWEEAFMSSAQIPEYPGSFDTCLSYN